MKVIIPFILIIFFISCKKQDNLDNDQLYSLNISAVKVESTSNVKAESGVTVDLKNYINQLNYYVYNTDGILVASLLQNSSSPDVFGSGEIKLVKGKYKLVVIGLKVEGKNVVELSGSNNISKLSVTWTYIQDKFFRYQGVGPTYKSDVIEFEVTDANPTINKDINLKRVYNQIDIVINDKIPADVSIMNLTLSSYNTYYYFYNPTVSAPISYRFDIKPFIGKENTVVSFLNIMTEDKIQETIVISFDKIDASGSKVIRPIPNVNLERGKVTKLSGTVFTTSSNSDNNNFGVTTPELSKDTIFVKL